MFIVAEKLWPPMPWTLFSDIGRLCRYFSFPPKTDYKRWCLVQGVRVLSGPLPAEWIFQRRFSLHAWILQGCCSEFCCGFLSGFSVLRLKGRKAPRNPQKKFMRNSMTKSTLPEWKFITTNALQKGSLEYCWVGVVSVWSPWHQKT